jgi:hypothetical protein
LETVKHYWGLSQYESVINYGRLYNDKAGKDAGKVNYMVMKAAYAVAQSASDCPGKCLLHKRGISLFESMTAEGWSGSEKENAQKLYDKLKQQSTKQ